MKTTKFNQKESRLTIPYFVHMEVTEKCPLCCPQCYCDMSKSKELPWKLAKDIAEQIIKMRVPRVLLTGGEPLLYPHLINLIQIFSNNNVETEVSSSGFGLTSKYLKELSESGLTRLHISLNGSCESVHNLSRSHFEESLNAIKLIKDADIWCGVNWVARHDNIDDLENLLILLKQLNVNMFTILSSKPDFNGIIQSPLTTSDQDKLAKIVLSEFKNIGISIDLCYPSLRKKVFGDKIPSIYKYCGAGKLFFDVLVDGSCKPCRHKKIEAKKSSLDFYWNTDSDLFVYRKKNYICCDDLTKEGKDHEA